MAADAALLARELTIVVTTSPSPIHPSTELLDTVIASLAEQAPTIRTCRLILVCDGAKVGGKQVFRSGKVDAKAWAAYLEYKRRLHERVRNDAYGPRAEVLELSEHHGFGFAVCAALRLVTTRLVCIVQHDRALLRRVPMSQLCEAMLSPSLRDPVSYVLLPTRATADYPDKMRERLAQRGLKPPASSIEAHALPLPPSTGWPDGARLLPCLTFYDSTHIATSAYYRDFIFPRADEATEAFSDPAAQAYLQSLPPEARERALVFGSPARLVTKGAFLEAELAPRQLEDVATLGVQSTVDKWRTWLLDDAAASPMVGHLNGAVARPWAELEAKHGGAASGAGQKWQRGPDAEHSTAVVPVL